MFTYTLHLLTPNKFPSYYTEALPSVSGSCTHATPQIPSTDLWDHNSLSVLIENESGIILKLFAVYQGVLNWTATILNP